MKILFGITGVLLLIGVTAIGVNFYNYNFSIKLHPEFMIILLILGYLLGTKTYDFFIKPKTNLEETNFEEEKTKPLDIIFGLVGVFLSLITVLFLMGNFLILFALPIIPVVVVIGYFLGKKIGKYFHE